MNERLKIRSAAVDGRFYPADPEKLRQTIRNFLKEASVSPREGKALIVPHAGYVYSGPVAASGYACIDRGNPSIERVILVGPSHWDSFPGVATTGCDFFETPLGRIPIAKKISRELIEDGLLEMRESAHSREHSLEVQLPFLQEVLGEFEVLPLAVGMVEPERLRGVLKRAWGDEETLLVISTDLSHYLDYETARRVDGETAKRIVEMRGDELDGERACGFRGLVALLEIGRRRGYKIECLDLRNSADVAGGDSSQVVGYGSFLMSSS